ncbi:unnamed protein product [Hanseniaspora opuntiae]
MSEKSSDMDASTKKKLALREKRKQQMKSKGAGSSRLQKITGGANSLMDADSVLDKPKPVVSAEPTEAESMDFMKQTEAWTRMMNMMKNFAPGAEGMAGQQAAAVTPEVQLYHTAKLKQFQYRLLFIKWFVVLAPYLYLLTHPGNSALGAFFNDRKNFLMIFSTIEVLSVSLSFAFTNKLEKVTKYKQTPGGSIISYLKFIPNGILPFDLHKVVTTALTWFSVVNGALIDFSFVVIVLVLLSYYHI